MGGGPKDAGSKCTTGHPSTPLLCSSVVSLTTRNHEGVTRKERDHVDNAAWDRPRSSRIAAVLSDIGILAAVNLFHAYV